MECHRLLATIHTRAPWFCGRACGSHGCFNSWDRLPFSPGKGPENRDLVGQNLALSNFNSYNGLDTDDNSAYFHMQDNVLVYGHFLKSDFSGHDIEYDGDFGVFVGASNQYQRVPSAHRNSVHDCTILSESDGDNLASLTPSTCNGSFDDFPRIYNIRVYSPSATTTVCGETIAAMQGKGLLKNVTAGLLSHWTPGSVVERAKQVLGMP